MAIFQDIKVEVFDSCASYFREKMTNLLVPCYKTFWLVGIGIRFAVRVDVNLLVCLEVHNCGGFFLSMILLLVKAYKVISEDT